MELNLRKSQLPGGPGEAEAPGLVYAIVPAHGGANADSVAMELSRELSEGYQLAVLLADFCARGFPVWNSGEAPQRLDGRTWGAFVTPGEHWDRLEAREASPRHISRLLEHARAQYQVTCVDLSDAKESAALEVLRNSDSIFMVANSDRQSVEQARYRGAWLRSMDLDDRAGLLLNRVSGGVSGVEAEDRTGLPLCAALEKARDLHRLADWLAAPLGLTMNGLGTYACLGYSELALRVG